MSEPASKRFLAALSKSRKPEWEGMAPCGIHGADFKGQQCDICPHPEAVMSNEAEHVAGLHEVLAKFNCRLCDMRGELAATVAERDALRAWQLAVADGIGFEPEQPPSVIIGYVKGLERDSNIETVYVLRARNAELVAALSGLLDRITSEPDMSGHLKSIRLKLTPEHATSDAVRHAKVVLAREEGR